MSLTKVNTDYTKMRCYNASNQWMDVTADQFTFLKQRLFEGFTVCGVFFPNWTVQRALNEMWDDGNFAWYPRDFYDNFTTAAVDTEFAATASRIPCGMFWELVPNLDDEQAWESALAEEPEKGNTAFREGFATVAERLKQGLLDVQLNTEVIRIDYPASTNFVTVRRLQGRRFPTELHCISTPSTGGR